MESAAGNDGAWNNSVVGSGSTFGDSGALGFLGAMVHRRCYGKSGGLRVALIPIDARQQKREKKKKKRGEERKEGIATQ